MPNPNPDTVETALRRLRMDATDAQVNLTNVQARVTDLLKTLSPEQLARPIASRINADAYQPYSTRPTPPPADLVLVTPNELEHAAANGFRIPAGASVDKEAA
jgi:hypothetical protein